MAVAQMAHGEGQTLQSDLNWSKIVGQASLPIRGGQTLAWVSPPYRLVAV